MNETRAERSHGFHWRNDKSRSTETTHASAAFELIGCQGGGNTTAASTVCRQVDEVLSQRHAHGAAASSARGDVGTMVGLIVVSPMPEDLFFVSWLTSTFGLRAQEALQLTRSRTNRPVQDAKHA